MIEIGKLQKLQVINTTDFGVYLGEDSEEKVLLPKKQVPEGTKPGDEIEVFIYKDSSDRLISTTNEPKIKLGEIKVLEVKEMTKIGAFLDWGLEKDLLLPFSQQTKKVQQGEKHLVVLYIDKSDRLCATMKLYEYMKPTEEYKREDIVTGIVYEIKPDLGAFVAVDNMYFGLVPKRELFEVPEIGEMITARVTDLREDGKLNLSIRKKAYIQMDEDSLKVLEILENKGGFVLYGEKASPDIIKKDFKLSKNAFKRALGRLLKEGKIEIKENQISIKEAK